MMVSKSFREMCISELYVARSVTFCTMTSKCQKVYIPYLFFFHLYLLLDPLRRLVRVRPVRVLVLQREQDLLEVRRVLIAHKGLQHPVPLLQGHALNHVGLGEVVKEVVGDNTNQSFVGSVE